MRKLTLLFVACLSLMVVHAVTVSSSSVATPGVWNSNFGISKAYADANHVPMLVFWGSTSCPKCRSLKSAIENADFITWQNEQKLVMVLVENTPDDDAKACKAFAKNSSLEWPYIAVYWNKSNGQVVKQVFTGRSGTMPGSGSTLQAKLMSSVEMYTTGWSSDGVVTSPDSDSDSTETEVTPAVTGDEWKKSRKLIAGVYSSDGNLAGMMLISAGRKNSKNVAKIGAKFYMNNGKYVTLTSKRINVSESNRISLTGKASCSMDISDPDAISGTVTYSGVTYSIVPDTIGGKMTATLTFHLDENFPSTINNMDVRTDLLPEGQTIQASGMKWVIAKNSASLRLTYKYSTGYFKGTFVVAVAKTNTSTKKIKAKVTGFFSQDNGGYGLVTITNVGTFPCKITK